MSYACLYFACGLDFCAIFPVFANPNNTTNNNCRFIKCFESEFALSICLFQTKQSLSLAVLDRLGTCVVFLVPLQLIIVLLHILVLDLT